MLHRRKEGEESHQRLDKISTTWREEDGWSAFWLLIIPTIELA